MSQGIKVGASVSRERSVDPPADALSRRHCLEMHIGEAFSFGNAVRPLHNGRGIFPPMLQAIREARNSINLLSYIYRKGDIAERFCQALCERARAGVTVRVLVDAIGAAEMRSDHAERMREAGVDMRRFRKPHRFPFKADKRTHRKALICDNSVGFTGGMGIGRRWEGDARDPSEWREMHFEFRGPCVFALNGSFWDNWIEACPEARPDFSANFEVEERPGEAAVQLIHLDSGRSDQTARVLMQTLFGLARKRIDIVSAYLSPDKDCLALLKERVRDGVRVRILVPGPHNDVKLAKWEAERHYPELIEAGIGVYCYQPTMMHSKAVLVDDDFGVAGSLNFDQRSFNKDEEVVAVVQDQGFVREMDAALADDLSVSEQLRLKDVLPRPLSRRFLQAIARVFRSQL